MGAPTARANDRLGGAVHQQIAASFLGVSCVLVVVGLAQLSWVAVLVDPGGTVGYALERTAPGVAFAGVLDVGFVRHHVPGLLSAPVGGSAATWTAAGWLCVASISLALALAPVAVVVERCLVPALPRAAVRWGLLAFAPLLLAGAAGATPGSVAVGLAVALAVAGLVAWATLAESSIPASALAFVALALALGTGHRVVEASVSAPTAGWTSPPSWRVPSPHAGEPMPPGTPTVSRSRPADVPEPCNVVVVMIDTLRADHLPFYGYERQTAPRLSRMADESGIVFERAYAPSSWTSPSTFTLLTSLAPTQHGIELWSHRLDPDVPTLAGAFRADGFRTAAFIANMAVRPSKGTGVGFEQSWSLDGAGDLPPVYMPAGSVNARVLEWIDRHQSDRFFLYVHYIDPHSHYGAPPPFRDRFVDPAYAGPVTGHWREARPYISTERRMPREDLDHLTDLYDGEIAYVDHHVGRLVDRLKELALWDDTLMVVVSDHGEELQDHDGMGHVRTLYEELVHVPLVLWLPGGRPEGFREQVSERVRLEHVPPTLLHVAGSPIPRSFEGRSLVPLLRAPGRDDEVFLRVRSERSIDAIIQGDHKLVVHLDSGRRELFDLARDPAERSSLIAERPDEAEALQELLRTHEREVARRGGPDVHRVELSERERQQLEELGYTQAEPD